MTVEYKEVRDQFDKLAYQLTDIASERDQLREERVKLQDENESLRHDLKEALDRLNLEAEMASTPPPLKGESADIKEVHRRINALAVIIGNRIGGLEERINGLAPPLETTAPAETTSSEALARGDEVHLEDTPTRGGHHLTGWFTVTAIDRGGDLSNTFIVQVADERKRISGARPLYWIDPSFITEIRHAHQQ